jgi:hypothetical protein
MRSGWSKRSLIRCYRSWRPRDASRLRSAQPQGGRRRHMRDLRTGTLLHDPSAALIGRQVAAVVNSPRGRSASSCRKSLCWACRMRKVTSCCLRQTIACLMARACSDARSRVERRRRHRRHPPNRLTPASIQTRPCRTFLSACSGRTASPGIRSRRPRSLHGCG